MGEFPFHVDYTRTSLLDAAKENFVPLHPDASAGG
jgi:hypothetical protein